MKYHGKITDPLDLVTKEYVDDGLDKRVESKTLTKAQYDALPAADKAKDILYNITDDESSENFQPIITASGVLVGNGGGGISAKTLDTSSLANDDNHIPTSGAVKSALGKFVRPNLLDNWYFVGGGGLGVPTGTKYYSDTALSSEVGTTSAYMFVTAKSAYYATISVGGTNRYVAIADVQLYGLPVNQRGANAYTGKCYGIDRWTGGNNYGQIQLTGSGVAVSGSTNWHQIVQYVNPELFSQIEGNTVTFSVLTADGKLTTVTTNMVGGYTFADTPSGNGRIVFENRSGVLPYVALRGFQGKTETYVAAKLEIGDTQTLARQENGVWVLNDAPPSYGTALFNCQTSRADTEDTYANKTNILASKFNVQSGHKVVITTSGIANVFSILVTTTGPSGYNAVYHLSGYGENQSNHFITAIASDTNISVTKSGTKFEISASGSNGYRVTVVPLYQDPGGLNVEIVSTS